ncbi:MAG: xanthine dehydrogenase small subunit [Xanthobacteraceae bacterium]
MSAVQFLLNGKMWREENAPPTMTVLDWVRNHAHLTGTKEGCAEGDCGACTIAVASLVEGPLHYRAVNSCLMMLPQIDRCAVLTIEGIAAADGALHPLQQAMIEADATQCGFCTPGFVMAMFVFAKTGERSDDATIHDALAGNLCRCTGYRAIVDACRRTMQSGSEHFASAGVADATSADVARLAASAPGDGYRRGAQVFHTPHSLSGVFAAMQTSPNAILLGGGTDLGLRVSKDREPLPAIISIAAVGELTGISNAGDVLEIGGAVTYTQALPHLERHFPSFGALVHRIGSRQIRNLGTLAGNLATASPIGDTLPCLIALEATVRLVSATSQRELSVEAFITGYRQTALLPGEVIASIRIPLLRSGMDFAVYKISKRFDQDISTVIGAFRLERHDGSARELRAVYGGMAARPQRARELESSLNGRPWTAAALADIDACLARDFTPLSDHRGSSVYRLRVAAGLLRRFQLETTSTAVLRLEAL